MKKTFVCEDVASCTDLATVVVTVSLVITAIHGMAIVGLSLAMILLAMIDTQCPFAYVRQGSQHYYGTVPSGSSGGLDIKY